MTPTPRLRLVERIEPISTHADGSTIGRSVKVLQQWYYYDINYPTENGEWKDVPTEKEEV